MEGNSNWKPNQQGGDSLATNNANDWRSQLEPDMRKKVIVAIVEKLKTYYPTRHPNELKNTALSFEGKIYGVATDKDDYMRKIKGNIMSFDRKFRTLQSSNVQSGSSVNGTNPPDSAQALNQGQTVSTSLTYTQTPTSQQWLPQTNIQSNLNILEPSGLPIQVSTTVSVAQNLNIPMGEGVHSNLLPGSQRQIQAREQQQPQQKPQSSNYFQNQMDQQLLKDNMHHGNSRPLYMQPPIQQQLPHQTSLSSIQQSFPQPSALPSPSSGQQNSQFLSRHNHFPAQRVHSSHHQQQMSVPSQEQKRQEREQLISHLMNDQDTQQNQLTSLQNSGEQQAAFRVSSSQQTNNIASFQERPPLQNNNIQQRLYSHSNNASAIPSQQQQYNIHGSSSLGAQGQEVGQSQPMIQQQYQPQHHMQQQPQNRILQQPLDDTQRFQASSSLLQTHQNQPYQLQRTSPANPSTSQDSTGKTVNASGGGDWQEETYQKIKALKEKYILDLSTLYQRLSNKLREIDALPQQKIQHGPIEKVRAGKAILKQVLGFLNVPRSGITEIHRDRFSLYEEQLLKFVKPNQRPLQHQQQQVHLPPSQTHQTPLQSQSGLTTSQSHTAMPHPLQTRPKMEPKEESNIMISSGHAVLSSLKQNPASNPQPSMFQQKQFHHLPMQRHQQQPQTNNQQQLQVPKNEMMRQEVNTKAGLLQQHISPNQRHLAKPMASLNYSSPHQLVDQQILPTTFNKTGTSSPSGGSLFVAPSPMNSFSPSPNLGDPENPISVESPASHEHFNLPPETKAERPIDRLIKAFQSSSPESLAQSISEMSSVISLTDRLAGSVQSIGGYRARVAEDLSGRTRLRLQQGKTNPTNKRFKRSITTQPIDITSETESYKQFSSLESEVDSTASSGSKVNKIEPGLALLQEITEVNGRLVETVVSVCNEDVGPCEVTTGTIVTCSYAPVALCDTFQALYKSGQVSQVQPLRLLVPENYPHSPILIENIPFDASVNKPEDLSARTRSRFGLSMKEFSEPMSLTEIAQAWDACARATMAEYAERHGGGTFSSKYGHWEPV